MLMASSKKRIIVFTFPLLIAACFKSEVETCVEESLRYTDGRRMTTEERSERTPSGATHEEQARAICELGEEVKNKLNKLGVK
ncbi:MAG: hypothetical protein EBV00_02080 [Burkholderiaceae bacterium]|nr:hypothetical protein [Burkholderiaceae bacterium]